MKPEKDKVGFMMSELRASLEELQKASRGHTMMMSTIDGNLAQLVELERENAKMLQSLVAGIGSTVSTIEKSTTENMECLHKLGPKVGEIDKKMKNIETGVGTVSRSHAGLVANVANIWGRFERWTKR